MDIRALSDDHAVSPQITPADVEAVKVAGFTTVICNRPDPEVPPGLQAASIREAVEAAGLNFVENPVIGGGLTMANVDRQAEAMAAADGPVLAYCASGNRCSIVWALTQAGAMPTDEILAATLRAGYDQSQLRPDLEALAARRS